MGEGGSLSFANLSHPVFERYELDAGAGPWANVAAARV